MKGCVWQMITYYLNSRWQVYLNYRGHYDQVLLRRQTFAKRERHHDPLKKGKCRAGRTSAPGGVLPKYWFTQISGHVLWLHAALLWQHAIIAHAIHTGIQPTRDMHHQSMAWHACDGRPMPFFELLHSDRKPISGPGFGISRAGIRYCRALSRF